MLSDKLVGAAVAVAKSAGIRPAGFLALIDVETNGQPFEPDGRTPRFLYERHVFYAQLKERTPALLPKAVAAGLAIPKWSPQTQYQDERDAASRKALLARAAAIDTDCAYRATSWGLGQIMGFEAEHLGYSSAYVMAAEMERVDEQLRAIAAFLKSKNIVQALNDADHCAVGPVCHNYAIVAERYNGPAYAQHGYDAKLAAADQRWTRKLAAMGVDPAPGAPSEPRRPTPPEQLLTPAQTADVQGTLRDLGYAEAGVPNGEWGDRTVGAISAFQAHEGLPVTGSYDQDTAAALSTAMPRPVSRERATTTAEDLAAAGSRTIRDADRVSFLGKAKFWLFGSTATAGAADQMGFVDQLRELTEQGSTLNQVLLSLKAIMPSPTTIVVCVVAAVLGLGVAWLAGKIKAHRVDDHRTGVHAGPEA